jgi:hypothetical protein
VNAKREAIRAYRSQAEVIDFAEAILGLNRYRGEMHSWPGGRYAEIFRTWRVDPNPRLPDSSAAAEPEETATIHHSAPPEGSRSSARRRL